MLFFFVMFYMYFSHRKGLKNVLAWPTWSVEGLGEWRRFFVCTVIRGSPCFFSYSFFLVLSVEAHEGGHDSDTLNVHFYFIFVVVIAPCPRSMPLP